MALPTTLLPKLFLAPTIACSDPVKLELPAQGMTVHRTRLSTDLAPKLCLCVWRPPLQLPSGQESTGAPTEAASGAQNPRQQLEPCPPQTLVIRADADTPSPAPAPDQGRSEPELPSGGWGCGVPREKLSVHQEVWAGLIHHLLLLQGGKDPENQSPEPLAPAQPPGWSPSFCPLPSLHWDALNQLCTYRLLPPSIQCLRACGGGG